MRLADSASSRAVLIGASEFIDPALPDLPAVRNNLDDLERVLTDQTRTGLSREHCTVLRNPNAPDTVGENLEAKAEQAHDMLLVYYAGHGLLDRNNELYLSLPHSRRERASLSAVPFNYIRQVIRDSPAANRIVILDCCFSGRAIDDAMSDTSSVIAGQIDIAGTYTLTSTSANTPAVAPKGARWTAFTGELLRVLREGVSEPAEWITLDLIYRHVRSRLTNNGLPRPEQRGTQTAGLVALTRNPQLGGRHEHLKLHKTRCRVGARLSHATSEGSVFPNNDLFSILGWNTVAEFDPSAAWRPRPSADLLRIPFGASADGESVELDLKHAGSDGDGPHGLCLGSIGSGKTELLRTIILSFMMTHSPDQLSVMIIDGSGGSALNVFQHAPHVNSSFIESNVHADLTRTDRMYKALDSEVEHRANALKQASTKDIWEYNQMRESGKDFLPPLPILLVVIDEFTNISTTTPGFDVLLGRIGRLGRTLGIHVLVATHRLKRRDLENLESLLSYRIGLRSATAEESDTTLGIPDAANLPGSGHGYIKKPTGIERFHSAYVSRQANLSGEFKGMTELEVAVQGMVNYGA